MERAFYGDNAMLMQWFLVKSRGSLTKNAIAGVVQLSLECRCAAVAFDCCPKDDLPMRGRDNAANTSPYNYYPSTLHG